MGKSGKALMIPRDAIVSSVKDPSVYLVKGNVATTGEKYGVGRSFMIQILKLFRRTECR
jgi:hypothetical protein